jgi:hypothetical protein
MTASFAAIATSATTVASAATSTVTAPTTTIAATATATRRTGLTWTRFVDSQRTAFHSFSIELTDGVLSFLLRTHRHEGKSAGFASEFVLHEGHFLDSASLREEFL